MGGQVQFPGSVLAFDFQGDGTSRSRRSKTTESQVPAGLVVLDADRLVNLIGADVFGIMERRKRVSSN